MVTVSFMRGEPLLSKLAAVSTFVVFPSAIIAYCLSVPDKPAKQDVTGTPKLS